MTELSTMLQSFVDQPVGPPPPIATLIERGRIARRRRIFRLVGASMAVVLAVIVSIAPVGNEPSQVAINVTGPSSRSAAYLATAPGGYEASGVWRLTIIRGGDRIVYTNEASPACGDIGTIRTGDRVYGAINTPESLVRVGEEVSCEGS